jgi:hypothetical protein
VMRILLLAAALKRTFRGTLCKRRSGCSLPVHGKGG